LPNSDATEDISNVNVRMLENDVLNAVEIGNEADFDDYVPPEALAANFQNDISVLDEMVISHFAIIFLNLYIFREATLSIVMRPLRHHHQV